MTPQAEPTPKPKAQFVDSTPLLGDHAALTARSAEDGYLFFKQLLPRDAVLEGRRDMLGVFDQFGWRPQDQAALGGRVDLDKINQVPESEMRGDIGVSLLAYDAAQKLESLHRLPHHPSLLALYRTLFDAEVLVHARHIARMVTSHSCMVPTPPHQDFPLIQGSGQTWTAWISIGDCPRSLGGLSVLRGSHRQGYLPVQPARGAGGIAVDLCPHETEWVEGDYKAGDILTFPSFTIHKALRCQHKDQARLSLDVRYQPADFPIEAKSLLPHCDLSWEEIYAGWKSDDLKYYWEKLPLKYVPFNPDYFLAGRRIC